MTFKVEFLKDGRRARVIERTEFKTHSGRCRHVPVNFVTDFASVPRFFWRIVPPWGRYLRASVVHDYLYYTGEVMRKEADLTLWNIMNIDGVDWWRMQAIYWSVRAFGWIAWNKHRKKEKNDG